YRCAGLSQPRQERSCEVQCGRECSLSEWSEWSECKVSKPCFTVNRTIASKQTRWRRVIVHPSVNKRPCEHIYEERSCVLHSGLCKVAEFETGEWSGCALTNGIKCGTGFRVRDVHCVNGSGDKVDPTECLLGDKIIPESSEECYVSCDKPCILSTWSKWTSCPKDRSCDKSFSYRTRKLLDGTERNTGCQNIIVKETKECPCMTYYSESGSSWSDCLLGPPIKFVENKYRETFSAIKTDKEAIYPAAMLPATKENNGSNSLQENLSDFCGVGTRYRSLKCLREDKVLANPRCVQLLSSGMEKVVEDQMCDRLLRPNNIQPCRVYCPGECVVSNWSEWNVCPEEFPAGSIHGSRVIGPPACHWGGPLVARGRETDQCPAFAQMEQTLRNRKFCERETRPAPQEKWCYVDCPIDCQVTTWTEWDDSKCSCGERPGSMKRRRYILVNPSDSGRVCPANVEETLPCPVIPFGVCVCRPGLRPHYSESMRYRLNKCIPSFNMSLISALPIKQARYLPETINGWMFALIGVGSAFVIFVVISVYLMCKTPHEQTQIPSNSSTDNASSK
ncbi:Thrombospondin type-1 domain-containing protein 7B, partial [Armadillidium nasatum]